MQISDLILIESYSIKINSIYMMIIESGMKYKQLRLI